MEDMKETNYELELYKLITKEGIECHWHGEDCFIIFPSLHGIYDFTEQLVNIFGYELFDEGGIECHLCDGYLGIDLMHFVEDYGIELEKVFHRDEYK